MSVPVPIDEMPEPKKERVAPLPNNNEMMTKSAPMMQSQLLLQNLTSAVSKVQSEMNSGSDLPYKCHLCESSFGERGQCLEHIKQMHEQDFNLIISKVNLESESEVHTASPDDDEGTDGKGGKYPDYANRKVSLLVLKGIFQLKLNPFSIAGHLCLLHAALLVDRGLATTCADSQW